MALINQLLNMLIWKHLIKQILDFMNKSKNTLDIYISQKHWKLVQMVHINEHLYTDWPILKTKQNNKKHSH